VSNLPPREIQAAERQVAGVLSKVIGGVMLWIGVAFIFLFVWAAYKLAQLDHVADFWAFVLLGVFALIATFSSLVGWRMFLNRPNRYGSILSPLGWRVLAGVFGVSGVGVLAASVALLRNDDSSTFVIAAVTSIAFCAIFCHLCLMAARHALANAKQVKGAL